MHSNLFRELIVSYPWIFWIVVYLLFRFYPTRALSTGADGINDRFLFENKLPLIKPYSLAIAVLLAVLMRILYAYGYRYESQIATEVFIPLIVAGPYLRKLTRIRMLILCIFPLMALVIAEQLWCTRFGQWHYMLSNGNNYMLWARQNGRLWERMLWFGGIDYPAIELVFYPAYIIGTFAIASVAIEVLPRSWRIYEKKLYWFFPMIFGLCGTIMTFLSMWFIVAKKTVPFHATAALMSIVLLWIMYVFSAEVRRLTKTPIFVFGTIFSVVQTAIFEFYHAGIDSHWVYIPKNELASLHSQIFFKFPEWQSIGSIPNSWPIEEWCAYPTLFIFVVLYLVFFQTTLKINVLKHLVVLEK